LRIQNLQEMKDRCVFRRRSKVGGQRGRNMQINNYLIQSLLNINCTRVREVIAVNFLQAQIKSIIYLAKDNKITLPCKGMKHDLVWKLIGIMGFFKEK